MESKRKVGALCGGRVHFCGLMAIVFSVSQDAAKILISPKNATSTEGQNVSLECNLEGRPLSTVTWWKGSTQIATNGGRYQVSSPPSSFVNSKVTLTIMNVARSDEGFYQCKAQNQLGSELSEAAYLTVNCKLFLCSIVFPPLSGYSSKVQ